MEPENDDVSSQPDQLRHLVQELGRVNQKQKELEDAFAQRIEAMEEQVAQAVAAADKANAAAAAAQAQISRQDAQLAEQAQLCAVLSAEVKLLRKGGTGASHPSERTAPPRASAPLAHVVPVAAAAPASLVVPASAHAKVVVASSCQGVSTKQGALAHAVDAVCLVGALTSEHIKSVQLVGGGKDLQLQDKPAFAAVARGAAVQARTVPGAASEAGSAQRTQQGMFFVEVVLDSARSASMVLRDAHKLAAVRGMERTFVRRALSPQHIKLKHRLAAAHADALQAARAGADTRVRYKDDLYPSIQRRGADGLWRTEQVFRELPAATAPAGSSDGTDADKAAP
jgi:hypothetical protein